MSDGLGSAQAIAAEVRAGAASAVEITREALARIAARNAAINAFTAVLAERALAQAAAIDAMRAAGADPGPLAGVPFAVKNLFDIAGLSTVAGSRIDATRPHAPRDATRI